MIGTRGILGIASLLLAVSLLIAGTSPLGRVLMEVGLPGPAVPLLDTPSERGTALYRAGRFAEAADVFMKAQDPYNEGLAAAWAGDYARALVAFDRVLTADPTDREARANRALVAELFAGLELNATQRFDRKERQGEDVLASPGQGKARAAGQGDEANAPKTGFWMPEVTAEGLRRVPQIFDAQFIAANGQWLDTLEDQPGAYLKARLAAEQKARVAAGTALPPAEDPE
ncbi:MAG: hypothetical protein AAGH68_07415 [Pseudomonadota bacterium]